MKTADFLAVMAELHLHDKEHPHENSLADAVMALIDVSERDGAEEMRREMIVELTQALYLGYGMDKQSIGSICDRLRSLPLPGDVEAEVGPG